MEKIKKRLHNLSLKACFVLYTLSFTIIAVLLIITTLLICQNVKNDIYDNYPLDTSHYEMANNTQSETPQTFVYIPSETKFSESDSSIMSWVNLVEIICIPIYSVICLILAATLFFKTKIKAPMQILKSAYEKISENDLSFVARYDSTDEMGDLIKSFEKMRTCLEENNRLMWRQAEQRKQINAAFAHDLRTPLTVLKGHLEMLRTDTENSETVDTATTMEKHIGRLERYVDSMSNLQKLEDTVLSYQRTNIKELVYTLRQSAMHICFDKNTKLAFEDFTINADVQIDDDVICTVVENLVSNAVRYAKSTVKVEVANKDRAITVIVSDDGKGFTPEGLKKATEPYYTDGTDRAEHFGLGLYISRVLCEIHGGTVTVCNRKSGAMITASFLSKS